jgi:exosortase C (VPDSG-CTERM-specific)
MQTAAKTAQQRSEPEALHPVNPELRLKSAPPNPPMPLPPASRRRIVIFGLFALLLILSFSRPLLQLVKYALSSSFYSHILLIPAISAYLVWLRRDRLLHSLTLSPTLPGSNASTLWSAGGFFLIGLSTLLGYWFSLHQGWHSDHNDYLSITIFAFVMFFCGGLFACFGCPILKPFLFPLAFLLFIVPFPTLMIHWFEWFFQHASAEAAALLFPLSGTPVLRSGLIFQFPGFNLEVAEECSGIRSSLVLFITSLLAGYMFLKRPGSRVLLALAVIPLGIIRNAIRIFTIAMLCVHIDPGMLDSPLHHKGGPIFFVLSLIPFAFLLLLIHKFEKRRPAVNPPFATPESPSLGRREPG